VHDEPIWSTTQAMAKFEHVRHRPPSVLERPRELVLALAPMRSNVNLSRIVRLAGCSGIQQIIQIGPGKVDKEIARDAIEVVQVDQRRSLPPVLQKFKQDGYTIIGLEQTTDSECLYEFEFPRRCVLVIGNERDGLTDDVLEELDRVIEIPVYGRPYSYNVVTATVMAVYEYCKQFPQG
jgi:tRNA G18 (ribose-2'-O)-methylase SpoU